MVSILALLAAVAGGNLAVTTAPERPRVGQRVEVRSTGQVGDRGRLYLYRNLHKPCAQSARGERQIGIRLASRPIVSTFDFTVVYRPRRVRREWICGYLYAITCDAAGRNCAPATGLPPDAGFSQVRVRVRAASQSVNSPAGNGRVIT
ncbi:MAG: hypothetical protein QOJ29_3327 [Thermoleophilaceae bacterium]|nr:hypothetical protein [Thermoleophilaceae bacterium]